MLQTPFLYEESLTPEDFQKLGQLALRWSHIDHIVGNCLKVMLGLSDEKAVVMVFSLGQDQRLKKLKQVADIAAPNPDACAALEGLRGVMGYIQQVRNNVIHAIMVEDPDQGQTFHLRSKGRSLTKEQVFSIEELTNYAAHAALSLRYALGLKGSPGEHHPLPDKPAIPEWLHNYTPTGSR